MRRTLKEPAPSILVVAAMWRPEIDDAQARAEISRCFGAICAETQVFDFTQTAYYEPEMGAGLKKAFLACAGLAPRDSLPTFKQQAIELETLRLGSDGSRLINVDPMLVSMENVVIATSKNFPHRIYLGEGVYGDLAFLRRKGGFEPLPWTYADYAENLAFFNRLHGLLKGAEQSPRNDQGE